MKYVSIMKAECLLNTCKPDLVFGLFVLSNPALIPGMGKINEEDELDDDENECSDHSNDHPSFKLRFSLNLLTKLINLIFNVILTI